MPAGEGVFLGAGASPALIPWMGPYSDRQGHLGPGAELEMVPDGYLSPTLLASPAAPLLLFLSAERITFIPTLASRPLLHCMYLLCSQESSIQADAAFLRDLLSPRILP